MVSILACKDQRIGVARYNADNPPEAIRDDPVLAVVVHLLRARYNIRCSARNNAENGAAIFLGEDQRGF